MDSWILRMRFERIRQFSAAYRKTQYIVHLKSGVVSIVPEKLNLRCLRRLRLKANIRSHWVILTPCNPRSKIIPESWNKLRVNKLINIVKVYGYPMFHTVNRDQAGLWPDETGVLIVGIPLPHAIRLAKRFGQNALLAGTSAGPPRLIWT